MIESEYLLVRDIQIRSPRTVVERGPGTTYISRETTTVKRTLHFTLGGVNIQKFEVVEYRPYNYLCFFVVRV